MQGAQKPHLEHICVDAVTYADSLFLFLSANYKLLFAQNSHNQVSVGEKKLYLATSTPLQPNYRICIVTTVCLSNAVCSARLLFLHKTSIQLNTNPSFVLNTERVELNTAQESGLKLALKRPRQISGQPQKNKLNYKWCRST